MLPIDANKLQQIQAHALAIAVLLYDETALEQLTTLEGIEARIKLSGAQWKADSIPQVLLHRCAYLNDNYSSEICKIGMHPCYLTVGSSPEVIYRRYVGNKRELFILEF